MRSTLEGEKKRTFLWFCFCVCFFFFCVSLTSEENDKKLCYDQHTCICVCVDSSHSAAGETKHQETKKKRDEITPSITAITTQQKKNRLSLSHLFRSCRCCKQTANNPLFFSPPPPPPSLHRGRGTKREKKIIIRKREDVSERKANTLVAVKISPFLASRI